jgi:hypothetical protein
MPTKDGKHAYTDEERAEIIAHVLVNVASGRHVTRIFAEDDLTENGISLPYERTFWKWLFADPNDEIGQKLARARHFGVEALLDKAMAMAEHTMVGEEVTVEKASEDDENETVVKVSRRDMLGHRKLYIETMMKAAQMLKPKTYGPKLDLTSGGEKIDMAERVRRGRLYAERMAKEEQEGEDK